MNLRDDVGILTFGGEWKLRSRSQDAIRVVVSGSRIGNSWPVELQGQRGGTSRLVASDTSRARVWAMAGRSSWVRADTCGCSSWFSASGRLGDNSRNVCHRLRQSCSERAKSEDGNIAEHGCRYNSGKVVDGYPELVHGNGSVIQLSSLAEHHMRGISMLSCFTTPMLPIQEPLGDLISSVKGSEGLMHVQEIARLVS
jgi:hypothetical protein